ncbi:MAG: hypothetical protein JNG90_19685 [Planctomycetaceae bacterium]|nr:hypothetical protein [Planctomycetaceae bacterium]
MRFRCLVPLLALLAIAGGAKPAPVRGDGGQLELKVIDKETRQPIACRIHLRTQAGKPRLVKSQPYWHDHFVFDGQITLKLPRGFYEFEIEHGPEYVNAVGHFDLQHGASDSKTVELRRGVDMAKAGWWSGDFDAHRPTKDLELLMQADDLHVVVSEALPDKKNPGAAAKSFAAGPVLFNENRVYDLAGIRDDREGGVLQLFRLAEPFAPSGARYRGAGELRQLLGLESSPDVWIDVPHPSAWDLPLWLAAGGIDSFELANRQIGRPPAKGVELPGKPRDPQRFQGPQALGLWSQFVYYQILNAGFRVPPAAGSGTGEALNPLGYNRVYVYVGEEFSYDAWWQGFRAGKVVVTNGPLLQPIVAGRRPGHVFTGAAGEELDFDVNLTLTTRDPISYLEIIKNGNVERSVRIEDYKKNRGQLPALKFDQSGWFLVRAVTDVGESFRFGSTAPYYVEIGDEQPQRISRSAVQFFLTWLEERITMLAKSKKGPPVDLRPYEAARIFWQQRLAAANAD